jgi:RNA polymerase sigma-70 factor (ECF subfamily)
VSDDEFLKAVLAHLDMLYGLARGYGRSRQDAEDLVQETCARALPAWRRRPPDRVRPWLAAVCLNTARQEHRRRLVRPPETLDGAPGLGLASPLDTAEEALARVARDPVRRALWQLPAGQREAIALMDLCGFTAAQASELMGVARGTVLARVHRGHKRLAVLLEAEAVQSDPPAPHLHH